MLDLVRQPTSSCLDDVDSNKYAQAPAGDVPIRSVTIASDGSCLVAGNNKVNTLLL